MVKRTRALSEFVAEANEILEGLSRDLLTLDEQRGEEPEPDLLNSIFRGAHSLKGLSGMFAQEKLSGLAHQAEDLLDALRLGKVPLNDELVDALIDTLDLFTALLATAGEDQTEVGERATAQAERLAKLATPSKGESNDPLDQLGLDPALRAVFTEYEEHRLRENVRKGNALWKVRAMFALEDFDTRLAELNAQLKPLGELISTLPSSRPGDEAHIAFDLVFGTAAEKEEVETVAQPFGASVAALVSKQPGHTPPAKVTKFEPRPKPGAATAGQDDVTAGRGKPLGAEPAKSTVPEQSLRSLTQTVRVDIGRLDGLMNAVGELLLVRGNIARLADQARAAGGQALGPMFGQELWRESRALERKLDELQRGILEVRMVPLGQVFDKLARLVRRIVRESGKEIDFDLAGGDVELDKLIVEELSDPLMHLLRNAIDHGIERPEARLKAGKSRRGTVRLKAYSKGNHVVVEVGDDGNGLDIDRICEVALSRGLVKPETLEEMDRRELLNLVFLPGFSTRDDVSELSGRGVGLDVVKTNISRLSGIIDIQSERLRGTTFTLTLPLTLAILRALVVSVSHRTFALPLNSVLEILSVKEADLRTVERREVFSLRGQTIPFVRLAQVFNLPSRRLDRHYVVLVGLAQQRVGLAVDDLLGQQDIVTKPLGGRLNDVPGIAGATDLGNRRTVLVLDVAGVLEELLGRRGSEHDRSLH
ncbi:MAG: chemotaxis protein CheA [Myxococcaceae bacterium]